jgi:2,3-bisphosphoglycerate-dependent phosphoglycerate mutase
MDRTLVLVRHGQSEWNLKNLFTGWKNPDLTPVGIEEAKKAGQDIKKLGISFDKAFTSGLKRAQDTCDLVLAELGQSSLPIVQDFQLKERDYGVLSGLNKAEAAVKWGEEQVLQWRRSYDIQPPGGEEGRHRTGVDPLDRRQRPMGQRHPAARIGQHQRGIAAPVST